MLKPQLLLGAIFISTMAAQSQIVEIQPSTLEVAATGVQLVALNDVGHTAIVDELIGQDRKLIEPLLPYAVLAVNNSSSAHKIRAVTVRWAWKLSTGRQSGITLSLVSDDSTQLVPGDGMLYTPVATVNQYLAHQQRVRRGTAKIFPPGTVISGYNPNELESWIQKQLNLMTIGPNVQVFLEAVVLDDYSFAGSQKWYELLHEREPKLHR